MSCMSEVHLPNRFNFFKDEKEKEKEKEKKK